MGPAEHPCMVAPAGWMNEQPVRAGGVAVELLLRGVCTNPSANWPAADGDLDRYRHDVEENPVMNVGFDHWMPKAGLFVFTVLTVITTVAIIAMIGI